MKLTNEVSDNRPPRKNPLPRILLAAVLLAAGIAAAIWYWNAPASIAVSAVPQQTVYDLGTTLNTQGLTLELTRNSGKKEIITEGFVCSPMELTTAGTVDITATYCGKSAVFSVESVPVMTGIRVASQPEKTRYLVGSRLELQGFALEADYNDGSALPITDGFTCAPMDLNVLGDQEITVSYEGKSTAFSVKVVEIAEISLLARSARPVYMVGEAPDLTGAALNVTYNNGENDIIQEGFTYPDAVFTEPGTQDIPISYKNAKTAFTVDVLPAVTFENLKAELTCVYNSDGSGRNANGVSVNWAIFCDFDLGVETREIFKPTISCSWDHVTNGGEQWEQECNFETAKAGTTYAEFGIWEAQNSPTGNERYILILYLPDDPDIAGPQSVTLKVGCSEKTISFTLTYAGDYETGTGWRIYKLKY